MTTGVSALGFTEGSIAGRGRPPERRANDAKPCRGQTSAASPRQSANRVAGIMSDAARKRLLAIDDNSESAELIARIGTGCGYETRSLVAPRSTAEVLEEFKPDVLTLDLCMPEKDGFAIVAMLQERGFKGALVVISGQDDWLLKAACRLAEVNGVQMTSHLRKPINLHALRDLLNTLRLIN